MNPTSRVRLSLLLPMATPRGLFAASQVVLFVLAEARVELDLVRGRGDPARPRVPGRLGAVLFVAADLDWSASEAERSARFERDLRTRIDRAYARQGMAGVQFDLQFLEPEP